MDSLRLDLRYALRALLNRPGFAALAVLTLAVGIGVNAVAFAGLNAFLFKPLAFEPQPPCRRSSRSQRARYRPGGRRARIR